MNGKNLRPGQETPQSGQYVEVGPRGGKLGNETTSVKGKPLPPTSSSGNSWQLVDPTKHKRR